ncbi:DUF4381 family protein [Methylocystis echinoides]|uniref:DUF4381 domain-containing protein n=1 Tax=Methylocystis echinoides TaxID=29468 RepID=A0A9W6LT37_9HYPH|nr:DUF4381 family protein [Methylocystis echinoides]GLI94117.1 hypothetical protein LMG27198_31090 [Methylocystis echinoides]
MPEASSVVDKLRPLHPPVPDGTADILIMTLVGCVAGVVLSMAVRHFLARRRPLRRAALDALAASRALPAPDRLAAQARLLRDVACALHDGARSLRGEAWLTHLDGVFETRLFSEGLGRAYGDALYQPRQDDPTEALDAALGRLLARLEK